MTLELHPIFGLKTKHPLWKTIWQHSPNTRIGKLDPKIQIVPKFGLRELPPLTPTRLIASSYIVHNFTIIALPDLQLLNKVLSRLEIQFQPLLYTCMHAKREIISF